MCEDLDRAMEIQTELGGADTTKGAIMLFKAAATSMNKLSKKVDAHVKESDKWRSEVVKEIKELKEAFEEYRMDATKYRLIVEVFKALFGTPKRSILTLVWFAVIIGLVHLKDVIELLKLFVA